MCWSMTYYEVAIRPNGVPEPQACYSRVNVLEPVRWFHLQPFLLRGETVYDITSGQCACDFLNTRKGRHGEKGRLLRERLREFILERMELPCLEPCLILTWRD